MANLAQPWHSVAADSEDENSNDHEPAHAPAFSVSEPGIDLPGVGHVRGGLSCEVAAIERLAPGTETTVLRGLPYRAGAFPETLRCELDREERDELLIQLMFAAGRLADWSISKFLELKSQQAKEEAPTGETAAAGEGIRMPGMKHRICMLCGESQGVWEGEYSDGSVDLSLLGLNQRVGPGIDGIGHTLYTHRCGSKGGAR
jgi:hypothetical protein